MGSESAGGRVRLAVAPDPTQLGCLQVLQCDGTSELVAAVNVRVVVVQVLLVLLQTSELLHGRISSF